MDICAIVCEFNPFHNGHKHLILELKKKGPTHIVGVMSGNFVQRGDVAIAAKFARTQMAMKNGVDLVVELPARFSLSPAEIFAKAAIYLIKSMGCVSSLGFGSECKNLAELTEASEKIDDENSPSIKAFLKEGLTFSQARHRALALSCSSNAADIILKPNNILAIEYIRALKFLNMNLNLELVTRENSQHHDRFGQHGFASSSFIRKALLEGENVSDYMPTTAYEIFQNEIKNSRAPAHLEFGERAILAVLRSMGPNDLASIQDVSEGLENRIYKAVKKAKGVNELYDLVKTKRYTMARIRRIIMSAFLGLTEDRSTQWPNYIRVLGFNQSGLELLKVMKKTATLPIITKYSDTLKTNNEEIKKAFTQETQLSDLYSLFMPKPSACGQDMTQGAIILK